ncbi:hypothetical protein [Falsiroseomonas sp. HW251]|uniref:hypothetical protein n=1 Tax=Falsiroseomonas sp. HW251 TaxID=3390998 RepID=UPI003D31D0A0
MPVNIGSIVSSPAADDATIFSGALLGLFAVCSENAADDVVFDHLIRQRRTGSLPSRGCGATV